MIKFKLQDGSLERLLQIVIGTRKNWPWPWSRTAQYASATAHASVRLIASDLGIGPADQKLDTMGPL